MRPFIVATGVIVLSVSNVRSLTTIEPVALRASAKYSAQHRGLSFLLIQDGRVLFEQNADKPFRIYSGTKAFWNLAALAAAQDGLIKLDDRVADTIAEWRNDSRKSQITIRQLLDFTAGLEPEFRLHELHRGDRDAVAVKAAAVASPGSAFIYGPSALQVFHRVLKSKESSPTRYLERRVLRPLRLGAQRYLPDSAANPLLASGFILSAKQWAKLGRLVLDDGRPIISGASLQQCWIGSAANSMFAFGWWNNRAAVSGREVDVERTLDAPWQNQNWYDGCLCRDAPSDLVACIGSLHQRLYVVPSLRLIVVRHGSGGSFSDATFLRLLFHR